MLQAVFPARSQLNWPLATRVSHRRSSPLEWPCRSSRSFRHWSGLASPSLQCDLACRLVAATAAAHFDRRNSHRHSLLGRSSGPCCGLLFLPGHSSIGLGPPRVGHSNRTLSGRAGSTAHFASGHDAPVPFCVVIWPAAGWPPRRPRFRISQAATSTAGLVAALAQVVGCFSSTVTAQPATGPPCRPHAAITP